jgi:hypothetical protein
MSLFASSYCIGSIVLDVFHFLRISSVRNFSIKSEMSFSPFAVISLEFYISLSRVWHGYLGENCQHLETKANFQI